MTARLLPPGVSRPGSPLMIAVMLACTSLAAAGCIIVPTHLRQGDPRALESLVPGTSTRADVLMSLGVPDVRLSDDRYFVYNWTEIHAVGAVIIPGVPQGGLLPFPVEDEHRLVMEFGPDARLLRLKEVSAFTKDGVDKKVRQWIETPGTGPE